MSAKKKTKLYMLITSPNYDNMIENITHGEVPRINYRSKIYCSYKEAVDSASQYLREGRAVEYCVMEMKSIVRKKAAPIEVEVL